jgi:hypothetical protein
MSQDNGRSLIKKIYQFKKQQNLCKPLLKIHRLIWKPKNYLNIGKLKYEQYMPFIEN